MTRLRIFASYVLLAPLIVILGTIDILTDGRSRDWPFGRVPQDGEAD